MDMYADGSGQIDYSPYQQAIKDIESSGGNYGLVGPTTASGDRAYGAYQVMGSNVPDWTQKHYGQRLTPTQFLQNKAAQDAVFNGEFGSYLQQHGNPQDAASMWFSGRPLAQAGNASDGYLTTRQYVDKFNKGLGKYSGGALAFSGDDDSSDDGADKAALSPNNAVGPGALQNIMDSEQPNKLNTIGSSLAQAGAALAGISSPSQASTLNTLAASIKKDGQSTYKYTMGADGTLYRMDDQGGVQAIKTPSAKAGNFMPVHYKDQDGNDAFAVFDKGKGQFVGGANGGPGGTGGPTGQAAPMPTTMEDLQQQNPSLANQVQAVNEGRLKLPAATLRTPQNMLLRRAVFNIYPNTDENTFNARKMMMDEEAKGGANTLGGINRRMQTSSDLLGKVLDDYGRLGNTTSMFGPTASYYENNIGSTGSTDLAAVRRNLTTNAGNAAADINALQNGGRGTGAERENIQAGLELPYATPKEQAAAVQAHLDALDASAKALFDQKTKVMGPGFVENTPEYKSYTATKNALQDKIDKLNASDFSYAKPGNKSAASAPTAPAIDHNAIDAELKRRGLL